jgi:hypothetical protein
MSLTLGLLLVLQPSASGKTADHEVPIALSLSPLDERKVSKGMPQRIRRENGSASEETPSIDALPARHS